MSVETSLLILFNFEIFGIKYIFFKSSKLFESYRIVYRKSSVKREFNDENVFLKAD